MTVGERGGWVWRPLVGATLSQVALGIARPAISYAGLEAGADGVLIGVLAACFAVVPMFIALPFGRIAGRLGRIGVVPALSGAVLALGAAVAAWHADVMWLGVAASLMGIGNLGVLIGAQSWISRSAPTARYNAGFGWMTAGMALGQAVGPIVGGGLIDGASSMEAGLRAAFTFAAATAGVVAIVFLSRARRTYAVTKSDRVSTATILATPGIARYIFVSAAVLTSVDIITAYLPVLGEEAGIPPTVVGAMLAVRGICSTASRVLLGPMARRTSESPLILISVLGTAACLVCLSLVDVVWIMFAVLAFGGFFLGIGQPVTMTAVAVALPGPARSTGLALRLLGNRVAQTVTPLLAGGLVTVFGASAVFLVQVVALGASAVWEFASWRGAPPDERQID